MPEKDYPSLAPEIAVLLSTIGNSCTRSLKVPNYRHYIIVSWHFKTSNVEILGDFLFFNVPIGEKGFRHVFIRPVSINSIL
jgi:hypothetical protein